MNFKKSMYNFMTSTQSSLNFLSRLFWCVIYNELVNAFMVWMNVIIISISLAIIRLHWNPKSEIYNNFLASFFFILDNNCEQHHVLFLRCIDFWVSNYSRSNWSIKSPMECLFSWLSESQHIIYDQKASKSCSNCIPSVEKSCLLKVTTSIAADLSQIYSMKLKLIW